MILSEKFIQLSTLSSEEFNCIYNAMRHPQKVEGIKLLLLFNNTIDYYLGQENAEDIIMPIIHIPASENWAKGLCLEFLILKQSFTKNKKTLCKLSFLEEQVILKEGEKCNILDLRKKLKSIRKNFLKLDIKNDSKSDLIIGVNSIFNELSKDVRESIPYITDTLDNDSFDYSLCINCDTSITSKILEERLDYGENISFENIFLFHSNSIKSYRKSQLLSLNDYSFGLKRCFIFSFSERPYSMISIRESFKKKLALSFYKKKIEKYNSIDSFVTFSETEMDYIFNRQSRKKTIVTDIENSELVSDGTLSLLLEDNFSLNMKLRNICSLCFSESIQEIIENFLITNIEDFNIDYTKSFFRMIISMTRERIIPEILNFVGPESKFAIVIDWNLPVGIVESLKIYFKLEFKKIIVPYTWSDLDAIKIQSYKTKIVENKIVIIRYKSVNGSNSSYPNSYDSLSLSKNQYALEIINNALFRDFVLYDKYKYTISLNGLLYSKFRVNLLEWKEICINKPFSMTQYIEADEFQSNNLLYSEKYHIKFENKKRILHSNENVLTELDGILVVKTIKECFEAETITKIQLLEDFNEVIEIFAKKTESKNSLVEKSIRENPIYNLTYEEVNSPLELWRILLFKKTENKSLQEYYDSINLTVSFNTFCIWSDFSVNKTIPRSKVDRKSLFKFLNLDQIYSQLISRKDRLQRRNSHELNSQIKNLLKSAILYEESDFEKIRNDHSDMLDMLSIDALDDYLAFVELIKENINLKTVLNIKRK